MEWVNLHTSTLDSPEVVGADPRARATWLFLLRYCCGQENGGTIQMCADWGDRKWQQLVRVTKREVQFECDLWKWEGDNLRINFYPAKRQQEIEAKRKAGRDTVAKRWGKQASSGTSSDNSSANHSADTEGEREGEGEGARARSKLPESLQSPAFYAVWERWERHWCTEFNYGNPMPEGTLFQQTRDLVGIGLERAIAAVENSLANGKLKKPCEPFGGVGARPQLTRVGQNLTEGAA